jgi:hypothetical protein
MITQAEVQARFLYDDNSGELIWKSHGKRPDLIGKIAGSTHKGRKQIYLNCKKYWAYRLVWMYHHGNFPKFIDHIDCDETNNRIENLRECTKQENLRNRGKPINNSSGVKGVSWSKAAKKWEARCGKYLGVYDTKEEAIKIVQEYRERVHGDFAHH